MTLSQRASRPFGRRAMIGSSSLWMALLCMTFMDSVVGLSFLLNSAAVPSRLGTTIQQPTKNDRHLLIIGLGRVGRDCATLAKDQFASIHGTVRSMATTATTTAVPVPSSPSVPTQAIDSSRRDGDGSRVQEIEFTVDTIRPYLDQCTHILITVQPNAVDSKLQAVFDLVQELLPSRIWMGLISTTGVYGNHDGAWVAEDSPLLCAENTTASEYRNYEEDWKQRMTNVSVVTNDDTAVRLTVGERALPHRRLCIFRCGGIYDASRSALHTVYKNGLPEIAETNQKTSDLTNRIHSTDIARAVLASMLQQHDHNEDSSSSSPEEGGGGGNYNFFHRVYNVVDSLPESRAVVMEYAAHLLSSLGVSVARTASRTPTRSGDAVENDASSRPPSNRSRRRGVDRKVVSNQRMLKELFPSVTTPTGSNQQDLGGEGAGLLFPTYKEGLTAILHDPTTPWQKDL
jgi:hypothetical protein